MGTAAIQALIAGLGGGAESLGQSLDEKDRRAAALKLEQAKADAAMNRLTATLHQRGLKAVQDAQGNWNVIDENAGTASPVTVPASPPISPTAFQPQSDKDVAAALRSLAGASTSGPSADAGPVSPAPVTPPVATTPPAQQPRVLTGKAPAAPKIDPNSPEAIKARLQAKISADSAHMANTPVKPTAARTVNVGGRIKQWNPKTSAYDIDVGAAPVTGASQMTRGLGSGGVLGAASGLGSVGEMEAALPNLESFENGFDPKSATPSDLKAIDVFRRQLLTDEKAGVFDAAKVAAAADNLVVENPKLAIYGRNVAQWIVSDLNLSRNATDKRGALDMGASALALPVSNMDPDQRMKLIQQMQAGRRARLEGLKAGAAATRGMLKNIVKATGGDTTLFNAPSSSGSKPASPPSSGNPFGPLIPKKPEGEE